MAITVIELSWLYCYSQTCTVWFWRDGKLSSHFFIRYYICLFVCLSCWVTTLYKTMIMSQSLNINWTMGLNTKFINLEFFPGTCIFKMLTIPLFCNVLKLPKHYENKNFQYKPRNTWHLYAFILLLLIHCCCLRGFANTSTADEISYATLFTTVFSTLLL